MIGSALGHYRILAKLGEGGMGIVYLAEDDRLKRKVALKMLPPGLADDPNRLARFEREVKTVAALNHPNIITIYSVEEVDGRRFFTMEHIEGRTLAQMIPLDGMPLGEFLKIAVPLTEALAAAHARGIQHRDLKPSNVMVTNEGRVKVLDFGLAKLKEHDRTEALDFRPETTLTQAGLAIGTLAYMSPEQLRMQATDQRSDIFSLGVVLFEMATGCAPFLGQSTAEVISSILRDQPARVYDSVDNVPEELDQILRRCLEKEPANRWSSAVELREALAGVASEVAFTSSATRRPNGSVKRSAPVRAGRSRSRALLAAGVALAVAAGAVAVWKFRSRRAAAATQASAAVPSLAVLPLTSFSGEPEYFVDGVTDALISSLARIRGLRVISRQSAMHYKGSKKLLPEIARELGVDYVVEGSIARSGDTVRLRTQVLRADPETTLWSETFERPAAEILALESSFASALAAAIRVQLTPRETDRLAATRRVDPLAYEAYLQGRYWAGKFGEENFRKAQGYFERAVAIDPGFAPAWTSLAEIHQRQGYFFDDLADRLVQTETALARALELDPDSAAAHAALGDLHVARWNWADGEREIRRAIELQPSSSSAHLNLWRLMTRLRRFGEGQPAIERARAIDPLSASIAANYGMHFDLIGRGDEALRQYALALELDPEYGLVHSYAWNHYHRARKDPERGRELTLWLRAFGFPDLSAELERRLTGGDYPTALRWVATELDRQATTRRVQLGIVAGLLACAGEKEEALRWLERGYERRDWELGWLAVSPDYESLYGEPRFDSLVERLRLPKPTGG